jgi:uncharacterized membrane protein YheB (UPF0754 family)
MKELTNIMVNLVAGLCKKYSLKIEDTLLTPEHLAVLIANEVPNFEIKKFVNELFEDTQRPEFESAKELHRVINNLEVQRLCNKYKKVV